MHDLEMSSVLRRSGNLSAVQKPTVGDTKTSLVGTDHMGWLRCDGRDLSVASYQQLFKVIGYSFGGSGSTFRLPNPEGRVLAFVGQPQDQAGNPVASTNTWDMGDLSGAEVHQLTLRQMPVHNHDITDTTGVNATIQGAVFGFTDVSGQHNHTGNTGVGGLHRHTGTTDGAGWAAATIGAHNITTQTNAADNFENHTHTFTTDLSGDHTHTISTDGAHHHRIRRAGGNESHNNIQPTIWLGNLFVYCGKLFTGSDGLSAPFSTNKFPFPYTGQPIF